LLWISDRLSPPSDQLSVDWGEGFPPSSLKKYVRVVFWASELGEDMEFSEPPDDGERAMQVLLLKISSRRTICPEEVTWPQNAILLTFLFLEERV